MIDREDMMELTRRMTVKRTSFTRAAGCYLDRDGEPDGSFNVNFLNLSAAEREKQLAIAKAIPFSASNEKLLEYRFRPKAEGPGGIRQLLMAMRECGLKNDALMDTFYELVAEACTERMAGDYAVLVYHDRYDVPVKAMDKVRLGESEEVYEYLICAVCPLEGKYEPGKPVCGFLFPMFSERSCDIGHVAVYDARGSRHGMLWKLLGLLDAPC